MTVSNDRTWLTNHDCNELIIEHHKKVSDRKVSRTKKITDTETIQSIISLIEKMPVEGEIYVSFSSGVSVTRVTFKCSNYDSVVEFYNGKVKTPGTSFFAREVPEEKAIFKKLMDLL